MSSLCRWWRLRGGVFGVLFLVCGVAQGGPPTATAQAAGKPSGRGSSAADLKLTRPSNRQAATPADDGGELVDRVERRQQAVAGFLRAEVRNTLSRARARSATDPEQAENDLKLLRDQVERSGELQPAMRAQLVEQVDAELKSVRRQAQLQAERRLRRQQIVAEGEARERIYRELALQEQKVDQLMSRYNALLDEQRFRDAEATANIAEELQPERPGLRGAELTARMAGYTADVSAVRDLRHRGFVATTQQIELAYIPTPDEPPILYPDPETWQLLT